jgi:hypothetical protein
MTGIGGPGGIGGPKGPGGPGDVGAPDEVGDAGEVRDVGDVGAAAAGAIAPGQLDALAGEIAAGRLTPKEAIDRLVEQAGAGLPAPERAELRELLTDLVANDPHLAALAGRV